MTDFTQAPNIVLAKLNRIASDLDRVARSLGDDYINVSNIASGRSIGLDTDRVAALVPRTLRPPSGPIAWYSFDTNVATDISGNGYDGTYVGGMGSPRDVAEFDGADDAIDCGAVDFLGVGPLTITCNLRLESWGESNEGLVISNDKTILQVDIGPAFKRLRFTSDGEVTIVTFTQNSLTLHKWYHIAVTRTAAGAAILYVDGVQDATGASGTPVAGTAEKVYIGNNVATTRAFDGQMDDFRIYNRVLTAAEIKRVYNEDQKNFIHADEVFGAAHIFEVQSAAAGDGVYNCYEQTLDATEWADTAGDSKIDNLDTTSVEVLNIAEFDPEAEYVAHLAAGDLLVGLRPGGGYDDEGGSRWIGLPFRQGAHGAGVRLAYCSEAAPADNTIAATLDHTDGTAIEVTCHISGGVAALNAASPRLCDNDEILVVKIGAAWYCTTIFQATEDCDCYEEP